MFRSAVQLAFGGVGRVQSDEHGVHVSIRGRFNQTLGTWDVSSDNMGSMFQYASQFNQPLGTWNVSKVTNRRCLSAVGSTRLWGWDVSR